ncbi:MAG: glycosyltransferase family 4 protein [Treponema sp.]|nr:glycosyltransferase family 4 protein [Treponema sp.]
MNVIFTIDKLDMGGAARVVYELVKNIDKSCFTLKIICIDGRTNSFLEKQMLTEDYAIIFLKNPRLKKKILLYRIINRLFFIFFDIISILRLRKELRKSKPDIVHAHQYGIWAGYWTMGNNIPLITTVHSRPDGTFNRLTEKIILKRSILLHRNIFVAISKHNLDSIKSYWHLDSKYARYVNNGINIGSFFSVPHDSFTFINISRQDKNKNQSLIIRAFSRLFHEDPSIPMKLFLVGDGDTHGLLKKEAENLGVTNMVTFPGYVSSAAQYLSCSDVYISSANREGLSLSVLEAMASKLPVIATDAGGVRDLAGENGILIPCNDEYSLYAAMKKLRDNKEMRLFKGRKSFEMVQDYSAINMAKKYCDLYQEFSAAK